MTENLFSPKIISCDHHTVDLIATHLKTILSLVQQVSKYLTDAYKVATNTRPQPSKKLEEGKWGYAESIGNRSRASTTTGNYLYPMQPQNGRLF
jgi:hypothetical protein